VYEYISDVISIWLCGVGSLLLGNFKFGDKKGFGDRLLDYAKEYGGLYRLRYVGTNFVVVSDAAMVYFPKMITLSPTHSKQRHTHRHRHLRSIHTLIYSHSIQFMHLYLIHVTCTNCTFNLSYS